MRYEPQAHFQIRVGWFALMLKQERKPMAKNGKANKVIAAVVVREDLVGLAAEEEHECKNNCDCNGDDNEAETEERVRDCMRCVREVHSDAHVVDRARNLICSLVLAAFLTSP